jgi:predicted RNA-binding protein associated with RNAse of E/G family
VVTDHLERVATPFDVSDRAEFRMRDDRMFCCKGHETRVIGTSDIARAPTANTAVGYVVAMAALHPPKREIFDVNALTNTDPKGFVRQVDVYRATDFGLYMDRGADHPEFDRLQSWLLPAFGLRVSIFGYRPGHERDQRLYLDVGAFSGPDAEGRWHSEDWYLDLIDRPGRGLELEDVDELFDAHAAWLLPHEQAESAVHIATRTMVGAAAHGNDVEAWLASEGADLTWPVRSG